jgi:hypothetical protein
MYGLLKKVYGDKCLPRTHVFEWVKRFKEGTEEIGDDQNPSHPSTSKTEANIKKSVKLFEKSSPEHSSSC